MANPSVLKRHYASQVKAIDATDTSPRQVRVICSTEDMDRAGDIVVQTGGQLENYKKNPIVLYNHNTDDPIARASEITVVGDQIEALTDFPEPGISEIADKTYGLIKAGIINTVSIGFRILRSEPLDPTKPRGAQRYLEWELLEFSFVAVPANPNALIVQRANVAEPIKMTRKGLFAVGSLADILAYLGYLQEDAEWEAEFEGDNSQVPAMLLAAMQQLGTALIAMTQEEVAELLADDEPDDDDMLMMAFNTAQKAFGHVQKAGKVLSDKNHQKLTDAHAAIGDVLQAAKPASTTDTEDTTAKALQAQRTREIEALAFAPA